MVYATVEPAGCHVGRALAPFEVSTCPDVPTPDTVCNAPVDVVPPQTTEYAATEVSPVPPLATLTGADNAY